MTVTLESLVDEVYRQLLDDLEHRGIGFGNADTSSLTVEITVRRMDDEFPKDKRSNIVAKGSILYVLKGDPT